MTAPVLFCNQCKAELKNPRFVDEIIILPEDQRDIVDQGHLRMFEGDCPVHGHRYAFSASEGHSSLLKSSLNREFSKRDRVRLKGALTEDDWKIFKASLDGQYAWNTNDLGRWKSAL